MKKLDPEFVLMLGNWIKTFLIEPEAAGNENSRFSKPGDSGAIVFTKFGQNVVVLSMIFGGEVKVPGIAQNNTIAVDLKQALKQFKDNNPNIALRLDTLYHVNKIIIVIYYRSIPAVLLGGFV